MGGGQRIYDEIDDVKKIVKPEDDEAEEEESKVENLDEPETEGKAVDMDALLGGDDAEAEDEDELEKPDEELWEDLDIPDDVVPFLMPKDRSGESYPDPNSNYHVHAINMNRGNEWEKLGYQYGYVDHERKYHAPEPETYAKMIEENNKGTKARQHEEYRIKVEQAIEAIKAGTYKNEMNHNDEDTKDWKNTEDDINAFRAEKLGNIQEE